MKRDLRLPEDLWRRFCERYGRQSTAVAVRLRDGTVIRDVAVDDRGTIPGGYVVCRNPEG
jgi:hypothetical protein